MEMNEKLCGQGWYLSEDGYGLISSDNSVKDFKTILDNALNTDLKDIGKPVLTSELSKNKIQQVVLQIQKIRNISAPKSNEDSQVAPRMLKVTLTDGHTYCQAVEIANISFLSQTKTPPGAKLLVKGANVRAGYILLLPNACSLLGGRVPALYEKWEINKSISKHHRGSYNGDGPPPWVNFGQKIVTTLDSQSFKSLEDKSKEQGQQSNEFEVQRKDAIAEASSGAVKKVFGGGVKQSIQLQDTRNATYNKSRFNPDRERNNDKKAWRDMKNEEKPLKPSEKVSLFDFLEDKLGTNDVDKILQINNTVTNGGTALNKTPQNQNANSIQFNYGSNARNYRQNSKFKVEKAQYSPQNNNSQNVSQQRDHFVQPQSSNINSLSNNLERMSLNSQFASRSLKQHLNLGGPRSHDTNKTVSARIPADAQEMNDKAKSKTWLWKVGDLCMAKYWEDNKYYNAAVTALTNRTCVVRFSEYGNYEEVLQSDCIPVMKDEGQNFSSTGESVEYRRGGNRSYVNNKNFYRPHYK